ncbi:Na+/H+ antiporter NhaC [Thermoactinomyces mirandus]|uniref:Na+/H+ antiporter NhaC n=1 Tax=Thermoactinomyces mirandus TaxID=2756294 RepID=A0A7W1XSP0_9BACL|nr:Na+/H+ antiporter NhaC [Thermoactinomyces mirandus]MBA4602476.1 Na+/H+ antiporter NhaC [Thermoactinomyces mirandus]
MREKRGKMTFGLALIPVLGTALLLFWGIIFADLDAHIPLLLGTVIAAVVGMKCGYSWKEMQDGIVKGINHAIVPILILSLVGIIIGSWILAGTVPALIYYGLQILSPVYFLFTACIICSIVSLATGSSWTTAGTIGIALIGIGHGLGLPLPMVAGAIISGAYFGDKMSPLSDTTTLAPAMTGSDLFDHIRHMLWTTIPGFIIALVLYLFLGFRYGSGTLDSTQINGILNALNSNFEINVILLIPALYIIIMAAMKKPPLPTLFGGALLGALFALIFQGASIAEILDAMHYGYKADTGLEIVDNLLARGGLDSMMWTISLIIIALSYGGILEKINALEVIIQKVLSVVQRVGSLIASNVVACILSNALLGDQFLGIIIPGRMYKSAYEKKGIHPKTRSRILEDAGTLTAALIPWTACGAYMAVTLGVPTLAYAKFAFLNYLVPIISIFFGFAGIAVAKMNEE